MTATRHAHDLDAILTDTRAVIPYTPKNIRITWADPHCLKVGARDAWAMWCKYVEDDHWIAVSSELQRAPAYVVRYLVAHEVLHAVFPPRRGSRVKHTKAHVVAERIWPDYVRANAWLEAHA
jgi:hypothetical protein